MTDLLLRTGIALAVVILAIGAAAFLYRKRKPGRPGLIDVVAYQPLGPRRGVAAIRVGGEVLVVGVTNADLKLFKVLREEDLGTGGSPAIAEKVRRLRRINEAIDG